MKSKLLFIGLASIALLAAGCSKTPDATTNTNADTSAEAGTPPATPPASTKKTSQVVQLNALIDGSKQSGTANFSAAEGNKTKVSINMTPGPKDVAQPAHVHVGVCPGVGAVKYPLTSVINGKSETTLDIPFANLFTQLPLAVTYTNQLIKSARMFPAAS